MKDKRPPSLRPNLRRRAAGMTLALFLVSPLASCSGDNDTSQAVNLIYDYALGSTKKITRDQAAAIPYATMSVAIGSGPEGLLVLGASTADELDWYAGEQVFVATRRGVVIRTVGLPFDLGGIHSEPMVLNATGPVMRFAVDYPDLGVYGAIAECARGKEDDASIEILGAVIPTRHIVERCNVASMHWRFDNEFWADRKTGYIWRSSQYVHPKLPPLVLTVLRPEQMAQTPTEQR